MQEMHIKFFKIYMISSSITLSIVNVGIFMPLQISLFLLKQKYCSIGVLFWNIVQASNPYFQYNRSVLTEYQLQESVLIGPRTSTSPSSSTAFHQSRRSSSNYRPTPRFSTNQAILFHAFWPPSTETVHLTRVRSASTEHTKIKKDTLKIHK